MAYATVADLTDFLDPDPVPANAQLLLDRASRDIDRALLTSVYDVEDADNVAALKSACLEQVSGNLDAGDKKGNGTNVPSSFSLGKLSVSRGGKGANAATQAIKIKGLWEQAWLVLQLAGLTGQGPSDPQTTET